MYLEACVANPGEPLVNKMADKLSGCEGGTRKAIIWQCLSSHFLALKLLFRLCPTRLTEITPGALPLRGFGFSSDFPPETTKAIGPTVEASAAKTRTCPSALMPLHHGVQLYCQ